MILFIQHVGDTAAHACRKIFSDRAEHSRRILAIQNIFNLDRHCASRFNAYEDREEALRRARAEAGAKASRSCPAAAGNGEGKLCSAGMDGLAGQEG